MERNLYIDNIKGIAALSIIFIHTTFWSGELYVPRELRNLSLLFDVPIFFFLSGMTSSNKIEKNIYRLLKLQITYMIFIFTVFILCSIYNQNMDWNVLLNWFVHNRSSSRPIGVVMGSMWYMKVYFMTAFTGVIIIRYLSSKQVNILISLLLLGILLFSLYPLENENIKYLSFYLLIFLVAKQFKNLFIKIPYIFIVFLLLAGIYYFLYLYFGNKTTILIFSQKFPPNIIYLVYSSFSLFLILVLKGRFILTKRSFLSYIGKNAIFYYFAQGLSSSFIYLLINALKDSVSWYYLLPIMFIVNIALAVVFAEIIKKIDSLGWKIIYKLKNITT